MVALVCGSCVAVLENVELVDVTADGEDKPPTQSISRSHHNFKLVCHTCGADGTTVLRTRVGIKRPYRGGLVGVPTSSWQTPNAPETHIANMCDTRCDKSPR